MHLFVKTEELRNQIIKTFRIPITSLCNYREQVTVPPSVTIYTFIETIVMLSEYKIHYVM